MTEIERELTEQLRSQQRIFGEELKRIGDEYVQNMSEAKRVIAQQSETLARYDQISTDWQINIDPNSFNTLDEMNKKLGSLLEKLEGSDGELATRLEELETRLTGLEKRLTGS